MQTEKSSNAEKGRYNITLKYLLPPTPVHEMGQVLGVGTLSNTAPFGFDRTLRAGPDSNPYFTGKKAYVF